MDGVHDLGGMTVFGPIHPEEGEPVFHAAWESRVFALKTATQLQDLFNVDEFRHAIERMDPARYIAASYYERWLDGLERLLIEKGFLTKEEIEYRIAEFASGKTASKTPRREDARLAGRLLELVRRGVSRRRGGGSIKPQFTPGDRVVARNMHPRGHTRIPRYVLSKHGVIDRFQGVFIFPDKNAHGEGEAPEPVYSVRFEARELWGNTASANDWLYLDMWESYLEPEAMRQTL